MSPSSHDLLSVFKIWVCSQLDLPLDIKHIITDYIKDLLFHHTVSIYKHQVMIDIDHAFSRHRRYISCDSDDNITSILREFQTFTIHDEEEHWGFWSGRCKDIQIQAMSCHSCGNYIVTNTQVPEHIRCECVY